MTNQESRNGIGGVIDRTRPVTFTFNGRRLTGYQGDTLASALLANNVHLVGRSFKYHRPRGIVGAGCEEPNAWMQVGQTGYEEANVLATTADLYEGMNARSSNCWPSVSFDLGEVTSLAAPLLVSGFYYKTFMNPRRLWPLYERTIRSMAGVGKAPKVSDSEVYDQAFRSPDILIVGAGPAGLAAALAAAKSGASVLLAESDALCGGSLLSEGGTIDGKEAIDWVAACRVELQAHRRVRIMNRTTVFGYYEHDYCVAVEKLTDHVPTDMRKGTRQRLWHLRAKQVVIATGANERPLVFENNDRPGIMLASAARTYANRYAVRPGKRAVIFTNNDSAYAAAEDLHKSGVKIAALVDVRAGTGTGQARLSELGIEVINASSILCATGRKHVTGVEVVPFMQDGATAGSTRRIDCDLVCLSGGWNPTVHLFSQSGGKLRYDEDRACFVPATSAQSTIVTGSANGAFTLADCLVEGTKAGADAPAAIGLERFEYSGPQTEQPPASNPIMPVWSKTAPTPKQRKHSFVDSFGDVTLSGIELAAREGYVSVEHLKRYTTTGMGIDQGRTGNLIALATMGELTGTPIPEVGTTTYRPPYTPVAFGALAAGRSGDLYRPLRRTAIDAWHLNNGVVFEDAGLWRRPQYYRKPGLSMDEAVKAEARNVRENVGIVDVSTLGKIHLHGTDVAEFLNRVYINRWDTLKVGRCRYGVMLKEDGMIFDDGVTARLGELDYHMTTTTGGAPAVYGWLDDLLQNDWPDLKVHMTSVTTQWAAVAIAGPNARALLSAVTDDIDCSAEALPFMSVRKGHVAGLPARVFSISFTGESSFEVNVPARHGHELLDAIMKAGQAFDVMPFGLEAMDSLRMEKGHFIVGRDTDGTNTPEDIGLKGLISEKKGVEFLGKRSLQMANLARSDRPHFVGLRAQDGQTQIPEGGQIIKAMGPERPLPREGYVTSSAISPSLRSPIALALIDNGRNRIGERVLVYSEGETIPVTINDPHLYDAAGDRLRM